LAPTAEVPEIDAAQVVDPHGRHLAVDHVDPIFVSSNTGYTTEHVLVRASLDADRRLLDQRRRPTPYRSRLVHDRRDVALGGDGADPVSFVDDAFLGATSGYGKSHNGHDNDRSEVHAKEPTATL